MSKAKRIIIPAAVTFAVLLLLGALVFFEDIKSIPYRLYFGDRITGSVCLVIDGEAAPIGEDSIRIESKGSVATNDDGSATVSIKGGEYGEYGFIFPSLSLTSRSRLSASNITGGT